jgi:hypothetical protein
MSENRNAIDSVLAMTLRCPDGMKSKEFFRILEKCAKLEFKSQWTRYSGLFLFSRRKDLALLVFLNDAILAFSFGVHSSDEDICWVVDSIRNQLAQGPNPTFDETRYKYRLPSGVRDYMDDLIP